MDHPALLALRGLVTSENPDELKILRALKDVTRVNDEYTTKVGVALALKASNSDLSYILLHYICSIMPTDDFKQERVDLLFRLPFVCLRNTSFKRRVTNFLAETSLESDLSTYALQKTNFAELLLSIPSAPVSANGSDQISEEDRLSVLEYIEYYLKPSLTTKALIMSNNAYSMMTNRVHKHNFPRFWDLLKLSKNYSYYNISASLSTRLYDRSLSANDVLEFMLAKSKETEQRRDLWNVPTTVKDSVETTLALALFRKVSTDDFEKTIFFLQNNKLVSDEGIEQSLRTHLRELQTINVQPMKLSKVLEILCRQTIIIKQRCCYEERHAVLKSILQLEPYTEEMTAFEQRMFYSILALSSYPKHRCEETGSITLFRKLIKRMFALMPEYRKTNVCIAFNDYENVMFCINALFDMEVPHHMVLYELEPLWRSKVLHALDFHIMTSSNLSYERNQQTDPDIERKMRRDMDVITNIGQILVFLFGVLNGRALKIELHYKSPYAHYKDEEFIKCFTTETYMELTTVQSIPGERIKMLHRAVFPDVDPRWSKNMARYQATQNGEWYSEEDSDDYSDDDEDSEYESDDDEEDSDSGDEDGGGTDEEDQVSDGESEVDTDDDDDDPGDEDDDSGEDPNDGSDEASDDESNEEARINMSLPFPYSSLHMRTQSVQPSQQEDTLSMSTLSNEEEAERERDSDGATIYSEYTMGSQSSVMYSSDDDDDPADFSNHTDTERLDRVRNLFDLTFFERNMTYSTPVTDMYVLEAFLENKEESQQTKWDPGEPIENSEEQYITKIKEYGDPTAERPWCI